MFRPYHTNSAVQTFKKSIYWGCFEPIGTKNKDTGEEGATIKIKNESRSFFNFSRYWGNKKRGSINFLFHNWLKETPPGKENEHDRVRCLSRFLGAVLRAKDHSAYLEGMGQTGLMRFAFPQIQELLTDKKFTRSKEVQNSKTKFDLVCLMLDNTRNQDGLIDEIGLLSKREPDREEPRLIKKSTPSSTPRLPKRG